LLCCVTVLCTYCCASQIISAVCVGCHCVNVCLCHCRELTDRPISTHCSASAYPCPALPCQHIADQRWRKWVSTKGTNGTSSVECVLCQLAAPGCVRVMSVGCTRSTALQLDKGASNWSHYTDVLHTVHGEQYTKCVWPL
jgi:hypothetical protein